MVSPGPNVHPERMTRERRLERNREIVRLRLEEGLLPEDIAGRFGLRPSTVLAILAIHGVKRPLGTLSDATRKRVQEAARRYAERDRRTHPPSPFRQRNEEMARLCVEESLSLGQIGARFGMSRERVRQILMKAGLRTRGDDPMGPRAPAKETKGLMIHLPSNLYDWLHAKAQELGVTKTALVIKALEEAKAMAEATKG